MESKHTMELTSREAVLLDIAIRYLGGSYLKWKRKRGAAVAHKEKCEAYYQECRAISRKIQSVCGITPLPIIDDGKDFIEASEPKNEQK